MLDLFSLACRSLASNALRTSIVVGAVLLGIATFSAVQLTNDAIGRGLDQSWRVTVGNAQVQASSVGTTGFADDTLAEIATLPGVTAMAPVARKRIFYATNQDQGFIELIGVDPQPEQRIRTYRLDAGGFVDDADSHGVVLQTAWAKAHGLGIGDSLVLMTQDGPQSFELRGTLSAEQAGTATYGQAVLVPLSVARSVFGMSN